MAITINNSANISYRYGTLNDAALSNIVTTSLAENYSLSAEKSSRNSSWRPSENLTFDLSITNEGAEPIYAVSIQDDLGGTERLLNYVEGSAKMFRNDALVDVTPTSTSPLTLVVPEALEAGETVIFSYVARVRSDIADDVTEITNEVTVVGHETSETGDTVTVTPNPSVTLPLAEYAEVTIEKGVDKDNVSVGEELIYTFRLENSGNVEATNIVITDDLPTNFVVNSITSETNGVVTTFESTDYSLDADNKLILPTSMTKTISVPASTPSGNGLTVVTIVGTVTD